jgi:hypothetical protein
MKVFQTSGSVDVKSKGAKVSHSISERFSQPLPYNSSLAADLAAVNEAWPRLPEAVRASIMMLVKAATT